MNLNPLMLRRLLCNMFYTFCGEGRSIIVPLEYIRCK